MSSSRYMLDDSISYPSFVTNNTRFDNKITQTEAVTAVFKIFKALSMLLSKPKVLLERIRDVALPKMSSEKKDLTETLKLLIDDNTF